MSEAPAPPSALPETTAQALPIASASTSATAAPAAAPEAPKGPRIYAKARFAWITPAPRPTKGWLGYLSLGGSVALKGPTAEAAKVMGPGCDAWYAVKPEGYICAGDTATIDPNDPIVVALAKDAPKLDSPWPFEYGESTGTPRYERVPTVADQRQNEWDLEEHQTAVERARARGSAALDATTATRADRDVDGVDLTPAGVEAGELFPFGGLVREARKRVAPGSTVAWTRAFDVAGRTFLLTSDKAIVPKDRVKPYARSDYHGVELGGDVKLPIAFIRKKPRPKFEKKDGAFVETGETWPRLAAIQITGARETDAQKRTFLETREPGRFILESDATVATERPVSTAAWVTAGAKGRQTWLDVSVLGGWLVAYEADKPVFATLISPGRGGIPIDDKDPLETASTPTGTFRVDGKFVTATMVSSTNDLIVHTEVQYVQNFHGPHALHGAYWHDVWGEPKSGGCINLSPRDAQRMFSWTEPQLPSGWYGVRSVPEMGAVTIVDVHR